MHLPAVPGSLEIDVGVQRAIDKHAGRGLALAEALDPAEGILLVALAELEAGGLLERGHQRGVAAGVAGRAAADADLRLRGFFKPQHGVKARRVIERGVAHARVLCQRGQRVLAHVALRLLQGEQRVQQAAVGHGVGDDLFVCSHRGSPPFLLILQGF